jgi:hypothetical protein
MKRSSSLIISTKFLFFHIIKILVQYVVFRVVGFSLEVILLITDLNSSVINLW